MDRVSQLGTYLAVRAGTLPRSVQVRVSLLMYGYLPGVGVGTATGTQGFTCADAYISVSSSGSSTT